MAKHNKKRNVGLIHEQLVTYVASSLVAEDKKSAEKAIQILAKHFRPGTELHREFRLFNALVNAPVGSRSLAERVLVESMLAASKHDAQKLSQEKSLLIRSINESLGDLHRLYDIKIDRYRLFATVQSVLDEWRGRGNLDITEKAKYEETLVEWLSRPIDQKQISERVQADPLVRKLMMQKFEKRYSGKFSKDQKSVLEASIIGTEEDFVKIVKETKSKALRSLEKFQKQCDNAVLKEELTAVKKKVEFLKEEKSDEVVARTLHLIHLIEEMENDN